VSAVLSAFPSRPAPAAEHPLESGARFRDLEPYRAPAWLPGGNLQTIYGAALGAARAAPLLRRERWSAPDGDFIDVDWLDGNADAPLAVIFHGLEGGSRSHYARALTRELHKLGWRGAVPHFRGCSGTPNRLPRAYHSGDSQEAGWLLERFAKIAGEAPLYPIGVSLGGNVLLKWLGESGSAAALQVRAAAAVSAPLDLMSAGEALGRGFSLVYARYFLATLKKKAGEMLRRHPGLFDGRRVRRARSLREFDDVFTAPLHGFRDTDDYWRRSSSKPWLSAIRVPTLVLNAKNDPFLPASALPRPEDVSVLVECEFPEEGGHAGFVTGPFPGSDDWLPRRLIAFFLTHQECR